MRKVFSLKITTGLPAFAVCWLWLCCSQVPALAAADSKFEQFLNRSFQSHPPSLETLYLNKALKQTLIDDYDYTLNRLRIRYWHFKNRSLWVLDEVGKEKPITMGVLVDKNRIEAIEVLNYRESRGGEIQHSFFRNQFTGLQLEGDKGKIRLNQRIDGITGATLSVRAMEKVAKVALFLQQVAHASTVNE